MNFLIMGAGALGTAFGGMLADAGYGVTLIGRERHIKPIRDQGLRISGIWGEHVMSLAVPWRVMRMVLMKTLGYRI